VCGMKNGEMESASKHLSGFALKIHCASGDRKLAAIGLAGSLRAMDPRKWRYTEKSNCRSLGYARDDKVEVMRGGPSQIRDGWAKSRASQRCRLVKMLVRYGENPRSQ
jgi:hypothetical protein